MHGPCVFLVASCNSSHPTTSSYRSMTQTALLCSCAGCFPSGLCIQFLCMATSCGVTSGYTTWAASLCPSQRCSTPTSRLWMWQFHESRALREPPPPWYADLFSVRSPSRILPSDIGKSLHASASWFQGFRAFGSELQREEQV